MNEIILELNLSAGSLMSIKNAAIFAVAMFLNTHCYGYGGNVSGTPTQVQGGTANAVAKYGSNGALQAGALSDNGTTLTVSENISVTGTSAVSGTSSVTGNATFNALVILAKTQVGSVSGGQVGGGIYVSTTIPATSSYEVILSSGLDLLITSTPSISTTNASGLPLTDGSLLIITSTTTQSISFQDQGTLSGSLLELGAATRAVSQFKTLKLVFNATLGKWLELSYGNN